MPQEHERNPLRAVGAVTRRLKGRRRHFAILAAVAGAFIVVVALAAIISRRESVTALVAAVGTALIVAWQSLETARAASAAEEGLRGANDSLLVSQVLAIEAERQRLDVEAPRLVVRINPPEWPPRVGRQFVASEPAQLPQGEVFRMPRDGPRHVLLRADGFIRNEGGLTARVSVRGMRIYDRAVMEGPSWEPKWTEPGDYELDIGPDSVEQFRLDDERPASEWIANSEAAERGEPGSTTGVGVVVAHDSNDNGVVDTWEVELAGRPFERIPGEQGGWRLYRDLLTGRGPMVAQVRPRVRRYYRSKSRQQVLPELDMPTKPTPGTPNGPP